MGAVEGGYIAANQKRRPCEFANLGDTHSDLRFASGYAVWYLGQAPRLHMLHLHKERKPMLHGEASDYTRLAIFDFGDQVRDLPLDGEVAHLAIFFLLGAVAQLDLGNHAEEAVKHRLAAYESEVHQLAEVQRLYDSNQGAPRITEVIELVQRLTHVRFLSGMRRPPGSTAQRGCSMGAKPAVPASLFKGKTEMLSRLPFPDRSI